VAVDAVTARHAVMFLCCALGAWALVGLVIVGAAALAAMVVDWWEHD